MRSRSEVSKSPHQRPSMRTNSGSLKPWRAGWSSRNALQPRCTTVTRVPDSPGWNRTSTSVRSAGAKLALRHSNRRRCGGSHAWDASDFDHRRACPRTEGLKDTAARAGLQADQATITRSVAESPAAPPPEIDLLGENAKRFRDVDGDCDGYRCLVAGQRLSIAHGWRRPLRLSVCALNDSSCSSQNAVISSSHSCRKFNPSGRRR